VVAEAVGRAGPILCPQLVGVDGLLGLVTVLAARAAGFAAGSRVAVAADVPLGIVRQQCLKF